jgi:hypothetical protein
MRCALSGLLFVVACGRMGVTSTGDGASATCESELDHAIDKTCSAVSDCVLVSHWAGCCDDVMIAIRASTSASFPAAEAAFVACRDLNACPAAFCGPARAEDGLVPGPAQSIVATCSAGRCTSVVH